MTDTTRTTGKLRRPLDNRVIAGVCAGLGRHFDLDPTIIRVAWVIFFFLGGTGGLGYLLAWAIIPDTNEQRSNTPLILLVLFFVVPFILGLIFFFVGLAQAAG
ncbi:MAG: PspC domain-containing protein [Chloroflexaceae bacterium]